MNFNQKDIIKWTLATVAYFAWFAGLVGLRNEHIVLWVLILFLYFFNEKSKVLLKNISVWLVYWMVYDSLRIAPNWTVNTVHIKDLYDFDKAWFGIASDNTMLTLNEWCARHTAWYLDLLAGTFYISWVPLPILFALWLYWKMPKLYLRFAWAFFVVNLIGFCIYYIFPAAPPWYVAEYGFGFNPHVARSAAGLDRVDALLNIDLFHRIYTRNSNVFAAMPSLHSAYPLVAFIYTLRTHRRWLIVLFGIVCVGIWLSAIYTNHHYVLDVVAGIVVALVGCFVWEKMLHKGWIRID